MEITICIGVVYLNPIVRDVWPADTPLEIPIRVRRINLAYEEIEKILLYFKFKSTSRSFLNPSRPININDQAVEIHDLPDNPELLTLVEKSDIDVSNLVKVSKQGEYNIVQVNVVEKRHFWSRGPIGTFQLSFKIYVKDKVEPIQNRLPNTKFCMHCGYNNPESSIYCGNCGLEAPSGNETKECVNCKALLPLVAKYCYVDGVRQPAQVNGT